VEGIVQEGIGTAQRPWRVIPMIDVPGHARHFGCPLRDAARRRSIRRPVTVMDGHVHCLGSRCARRSFAIACTTCQAKPAAAAGGGGAPVGKACAETPPPHPPYPPCGCHRHVLRLAVCTGLGLWGF
jgi:hypothetical protein